MRVRRAHDRHARLDRRAHVHVAQVEPAARARSPRPRRPSPARPRTRARDRRAFSGRWLMIRPVGWLRQRTAGCRIASSVRFVISACGARWPACTLACTHSSSASTSSGRSSEPSGRMSHSIPRRIRNGASSSFAAAISSRLPAHVVGVEPRHDADVARVVADRQVLVAERAAPPRPSPAPSPCRPRRSCGRAGRRGCRASSTSGAGRRGTAPRAARAAERERARGRRLSSGASAAAERRDVLRRAGRPHELASRSAPARHDTSTGTPSAVTPTRAARRARPPRRSAAASSKRSARARSCGTTTAKRARRVAPRRGSPAGSPPSASATPRPRARARGSGASRAAARGRQAPRGPR